MMNVNKLKGKIVENGVNVDTVAEAIGVDKSTFYRKLAADGVNFTIGEADRIAQFLKLTKDEVNAIFFAQFVA
jgi:hypothetical protein